jgi:hypothetical protein
MALLNRRDKLGPGQAAIGAKSVDGVLACN